MTDKKDDDLGLDDKLADDLIDDMDDIEGLDDLDDLEEIDDLDQFDDDDDLEKIDEEKDATKKDEYKGEHESTKELDALDSEISSLNQELDDLEEENIEDTDYYDDAASEEDILEEDETEESEVEETEQDESEIPDEDDEDLEVLEEKAQKKNALIMKAASGAFVLMIGGFVYNLMFVGELPNEDNLASQPSTVQQTPLPEVSIDTKTPSLDKTFEGIDTEIALNKKEEVVAENVTKPKPSKAEPNPEVLVEGNLEPLTPKDVKISDANTVTENKVAKVEVEVDLDKVLYEKITKGLSRAQGVHINSDKTVIDQDENIHQLSVGAEIPYYGNQVSVISIFNDGDLALLSNGTFIDNERSSIDETIMKMVATQRLMEEKEAELRQIKEQEAKDRALQIAQKQAREEERLKAQEKQKEQELKLQDALERINSLANEVEASKEVEEPESPLPTLLQGWSINGKFKAVRNGYVLNGYLVRDDDGNFYKMLVGDNHQGLGLIRGYDGNGRFFIGNSYIL